MNPKTGGITMTQIIEMVEVPAALMEVAKREVEDVSTVDAIVFGAYLEVTDGCLGTYAPENKTIFIDMGNALNEKAMYNSGMMFIPNVWYAILWAIGHEVEHARQLEIEPTLIEFDRLPQEYENNAMQAGEDLVLEWSEENNIPPLNELGWLGKQLIVMLNAMYTTHPDIADETDYMAAGAAAPLDAVLANHEFTEKGERILIEDIDAGKMGVKIGNARFLTANEFIGLTTGY
jgi:hypothetical protein